MKPSHLTQEMAMERALEEAQKGWGRVAPNPLVGCVVLDSEFQFLSSGFHEFCGGAHAEVMALKSLNPEQLRGAHVVVTLEPCSFYGKTPACAEMLSKLPIASVTYGVQDPNPKVSGKGVEILKQSGIQTYLLKTYQNKCEDLAENFLYSVRNKKPFVALKVAMSADECIAYKNPQEQLMLSNSKSLEHVHFLRANYDAILVGKNTVLQDDPRLNIRHPQFLDKKNKVIVLDPKGELLEQRHLNIFKYHETSDVFFVTQEKMGDQTLECSLMPDGSFCLDELMKKLYQKGIQSVFVEGGSYVYKTFIQQGCVNRYYLYRTPHILGKGGLHWNQSVLPTSQIKLQRTSSLSFGDNLFLTGVCATFPE